MKKEEYDALCKTLWYHNHLYYDENNPIISDYEYDLLMERLLKIEKAHPEWVTSSSPSQKVNEKASEGFKNVEHSSPMLSLANTYSQEELHDFVQRVEKGLGKKTDYTVEYKVDGTAISLKYVKGKLVQAATRGNGRVGDDITANIRTLPHLPLEIPYLDDLEVRGEVFLSLAQFEKLNQEREEEGLEPWANPRNAAAGSLKLLDPKEVKKRALSLALYQVVPSKHLSFEKHSETYPFLRSLGLPTLPYVTICPNFESVLKAIETIHQERKELPYEIDGAVIKVDALKDQWRLGTTHKAPRWAVAYKFAPEQGRTLLEEITVQVGRTGVVTPVGEVKPVSLAGSTISRVTLHNQDEIDRKDIRIGDWVFIEKGGDVIPKIVGVDFSKRDPHSKPWKMPSSCPACHTHLMRREGEVAYRCPNSHCPAQILRSLIFFASKAALDIDNLGEKVMEQLVEKGYVKTPADLYRLTEKELATLEGFKSKAIHNLLTSLEASKKVPLPRFIMALGIPFVGISTAEALSQNFHSLDTLMNVSQESLDEIEGIGEKGAASIYHYFSNPNHRKLISELLSLGVTPIVPKVEKGHAFNGKTFVLTGTLETYTRDEASLLIKERGGKIANAVSQKTDYLLLGADPGSKYDKAKKLGVEILSEEDFTRSL